ncbi:MAG: phosphomannomutase/phosphoglucomutase [Candidatus Nealsonbacteria bacterium]
MNPNIFKAYDIRGVFSQDFNEESAYLIGRAFVDFLKLNSPKIVIGRDNRSSSPKIFKFLVKGIIEGGGTVLNIGTVTTPLFYFSVVNLKADGGINITASHNPPKYNGFKIAREKAIPVSGDSGLQEIKKIALFEKFKKQGKGKMVSKSTIDDYVKFNLKPFNFKKQKSLKIIIDTANAVSGILIPKFFKKTNHKIIHLYAKLDGSFPNHNPDPLVKDNLKVIIKKVKEEKANLGIAFDGDGDRIFFINEKGKVISGDLITALMTELILKKKPGQKVIYDIRSSNVIKEIAEKNNGKAIGERIGHSLIKESMKKNDVIFAGELSGHYYFKEHHFCEAPFIVLFSVLEEMLKRDITLSELIKPYEKYYHSGEINFEVKDKKRALRDLEGKFKNKGKILKIDGLRIDFDDWWFLVRPSNTEPVIRLVLEAKDKKTLEQKTHLLSNILHG